MDHIKVVAGVQLVANLSLRIDAGIFGPHVSLPFQAAHLVAVDVRHGAGTAQNGIRIVSGGVVHIQNTTIRENVASGDGADQGGVPWGPMLPRRTLLLALTAMAAGPARAGPAADREPAIRPEPPRGRDLARPGRPRCPCP